MREQYINILGQVIKIGIIVLVFVTPLLFIPLPQNINDFRIFSEFNKQVFFVIGSLLLFTIWTLKMVLERRVTIVRTPLDIPLLALLLTYVISTALSSDIFVSIAGFYGTFYPSLIGVFALVLFYFTLVSNFNSKTRLQSLIALVISISIVAIIHITNYFGLFLIPFEAAKVREWTPIISLGSFAFIASILILVSLGFALQTKIIWLKYAGFAAAVLLFIPLLIINAFGAWVSLLVGLLIFLFFSPKIFNDKKTRIYLATTAAVAGLFLIIALIPSLRDGIVKPLINTEDKNTTITTEKRLSLENGWQTAANSAGDKPILGSGPGTFPFAYTQNSPISVNNTDDWNVRFEQASNEYANLISTLGIVGFVVFLFVLVSLFRPLILFVSNSANAKDNPLILLILSSLGGYAAGSLFFDTSLVIGLVFFFLAAVSLSTLYDLGVKGTNKVNLKLVSLNAGAIRSFEEGETPSSNLLAIILFIPSILLMMSVLFLFFNAYKAEVSYQKSIIAASENRGSDTRDLLISAIRTFGFRDVYHRTLSLVDLRLAQNLSTQQQDQENQDPTNIQRLVNEAIEQGKIASGYQTQTTIGTSRANVVNWESIAIVYSNLIGVANGAEDHAVRTYIIAVSLQPRNPLLYEALGSVYLRLNRTDEAIRMLETAVSLKPDLSSSHFALAQAYKQADDRDEDAVVELQRTLQYLPEDSADKERIQSELDEVLEELEKTQSSPSSTTPSANTNP